MVVREEVTQPMTTMIRPRFYLDSPYYDRMTDRLRSGAPRHVRREYAIYHRTDSILTLPQIDGRPLDRMTGREQPQEPAEGPTAPEGGE